MCLTLATDAVCCAGMTCCSTICCCCKACCGSTFKEQIKLAYIILNIFAMFITVLICSLLSGIVNYFGCPENSPHCMGESSVYRISFVLMWLYIFLLICMLIRGEIARIANEGLWPLKFLFIIVFFIGSMFISNNFFTGYVYFSIVVSGLYMLFQIIMLIDVFYLWGQAWIKIYDEGGEYMKYLLIVTTVALYGGAFTLNVFNFIWFNGCGTNVFMNVFTILLIIGATAVQLLGWNPQGSLLTSGAMAIYIVYQSYSAQSSWPEERCNYFLESKSDGVMATEMSVGILLNIVALIYLTFGTSNSSTTNIVQMESKQEKEQSQSQENQQQQPQEDQQQLLVEQQKLQQAKELVKQAELEPYTSNQYLLFHFIMFITVLYMEILFTNWSSPNFSNNDSFDVYQPNKLAYWVKMVTSWLAALLYIWTLIAPHLFPDRDFS